ncbi:MAG: hypothetical protein QM809_17280 [Gordonia sp. (in: high G+C Gram-positive bacteria)]
MLAFALGLGLQGGKFLDNELLDGGALFGGELDGLVEVFDHALDDFDEHGLLAAVCALLVAADAHEVRVDGAVAILCHRDDEAAAAAAAEDGGLEVVRVVALLLSAGVLAEDVLHSFPDLWVDKRFMATGVVHATVGDFALVVRRAQDLLEGVDLDGAAGTIAGRA